MSESGQGPGQRPAGSALTSSGLRAAASIGNKRRPPVDDGAVRPFQHDGMPIGSSLGENDRPRVNARQQADHHSRFRSNAVRDASLGAGDGRMHGPVVLLFVGLFLEEGLVDDGYVTVDATVIERVIHAGLEILE